LRFRSNPRALELLVVTGSPCALVLFIQLVLLAVVLNQ
jgi:hypothetical protein